MRSDQYQSVAREQLDFDRHEYRGKLVVIEGLDGAGKTTLIDKLSNKLATSGHDVMTTQQPTPIFRRSDIFVRYLYMPSERKRIEYRALLSAMLSDRLQHFHDCIRPALIRGDVVLCDRYIFTMIAQMRARGYEEDWLISGCSLFPRPDLAVLVDAPLNVILSRVRERTSQTDSYIEPGLFERAQEEYGLLVDDGHLMRFDTSWSHAEEIASELLGLFNESYYR